jgi:hypothetical protein
MSVSRITGLVGVHVGERQLVLRQHLVEQPERAAVCVVGDDHVIAGLQHGRDGADRRHPRRERIGGLAVLDCGDVTLERRARRVLRPRVLVALVAAELFLNVGRRLVDRHDDRPRRRVGILAGVDADCREPGAIGQLHAESFESEKSLSSI